MKVLIHITVSSLQSGLYVDLVDAHLSNMVSDCSVLISLCKAQTEICVHVLAVCFTETYVPLCVWQVMRLSLQTGIHMKRTESFSTSPSSFLSLSSSLPSFRVSRSRDLNHSYCLDVLKNVEVIHFSSSSLSCSSKVWKTRAVTKKAKCVNFKMMQSTLNRNEMFMGLFVFCQVPHVSTSPALTCFFFLFFWSMKNKGSDKES